LRGNWPTALVPQSNWLVGSKDLLNGTFFGGTGRVGAQQNLMAGVTENLLWDTINAPYPGRIGVCDPEVSVNDDDFLCETVQYTFKMVGHPLSFL
jgi:hypothetical protein